MNLFDTSVSPAVVAALLLLLSLLAWRMRASRQGARRSSKSRDALDTVADWPPEPARVMSVHERRAYLALQRALPGLIVLAQVPLARFLRVPTRHSYNDWLQRAGSLNADLLICDAASRVLAVIDIRSGSETERSRRRHERLARVLKAAKIRVYTWREGELPTMSELRASLARDLLPPQAAPQAAPMPQATASKPIPLIPVPEIAEVLADGDLAYETDAAQEPVPSAFFEDPESDSVRGALARG